MHLRRSIAKPNSLFFAMYTHEWPSLAILYPEPIAPSFSACLLLAALEVFTCFIFPKSHIRFSTDFLHMYEKFSGLSFVCIQPSPRPRSTLTLLIFFLIFAHGASQLANLKRMVYLSKKNVFATFWEQRTI